jgi:hypothetical protein
MGTASGTYGHLSKYCFNTTNPSGLPTGSPYGSYGDGACDPFLAHKAMTITSAELHVGSVSTFQATVGATVTMRIDVYEELYGSRNLLGSIDFPMDPANMSVSNNLGNDDFQASSISGLNIAIAAGTLFSLQFTNRYDDNTQVSAAARIVATVVAS